MELTDDHNADVSGMAVRRALPRRKRRTIGAWCFLDHFGPVGVAPSTPVSIGPHPHIGLQTVTWLLAGEQLHRDSLGTEQLIRPGQLNLMTAGHGIAHAEESLGYEGTVHGAQLWVALPSETRDGAPAFEHHSSLPQDELRSGTATWLVGGRSPARTDTPLMGVDLDLRPGLSTLEVDSWHEHGLIVFEGSVLIDDQAVLPGQLAYLGTDLDELELEVREPTRALVIGGTPFEESLRLWWNFVARDAEEIALARSAWLEGSDRFGSVTSSLERIAGPALS